MKKLKDKRIHEYTIRVDTIREHYSDGCGGNRWGNKIWCAWIDYGHSKTGLGGCYTEDELFERIRGELYLHKKEIYLRDFLRSKLDRTYKWLKRLI